MITLEEAKRALRTALSPLEEKDRSIAEAAMTLATPAHAGQTRGDGSPYVTHSLAVGAILAQWGADLETIVAGILHDALEDTPLTLGEIKEQFGRKVAFLVEGVTKFTQADFAGEVSLDRKIETLRKLFEVMRQDIRVVIIKLADRLHNARTIDTLSLERQQRFAKETLDIYYKLAFHLGMNDLRRELSDLCFPLAHPEETDILQPLRERMRTTGMEVLRDVQAHLEQTEATPLLRDLWLQPHTLQSLSQHRRHQNFTEEQTFFLVAIAVDEDACYTLLKKLHSLFRPKGGLFRDYIAAPTESAYRSLHTTVVDEEGNIIQFRIRTAEMNEQEQRGVLLKCFEKNRVAIPGFSWLERTAHLDLATRESSTAFWEALQSDILQETVRVLVDGKDLALPRGATVLDAVYARHGSDANRLLSAIVNGQTGSFSEPVSEEDTIQTKLSPFTQLSIDWLQSTGTKYARTLIVQALKERERTEKIALGERLLQKELDTYQRGLVGELSRSQKQSSTEHCRREHFDDVLELIGEGSITARDIVFHLFPEKRGQPIFQWRRKQLVHPFRLSVTGTQQRQHDILPRLHALTRLGEVAIGETHLRYSPLTQTFDLQISGNAPDRLHFADFIDMLERQEWISSVSLRLTRMQKIFLAGSISLAFLVLLLDVLFLPQYHRWLREFTVLPAFILQTLPFLPILGTNYYVLRLLRHHLVWLRTDRWFLGVGGLLNIIGFLLIIVQSSFTGEFQQSLLPLLALFVFSMLYYGYRFFQTEAVFTGINEAHLRPLSSREWIQLQRQKRIGYAIRLCAVTIWGTEPIYIKYTAANDLSPFLRTFLLSIGVLLPFSLLYIMKHGLHRSRWPLPWRLPHDRFFLSIIIGQAGLMYFKNASLIYTSGTNFLLFSNFAPVAGLLVATVFWRKTIPYLRDPRHMLWIFLLAVMSGIGSSLLLINSFVGATRTVLGDLLAMVAVFFDVLITIGQIEYLKQHRSTDSILLNLHIFLFLLLLTAPAILALHFLGVPILTNVTLPALLLGVGIGLFVGFGQFLNYEAFKRIDGYLAFMMFNLSVLITFVIEVFIKAAVRPTVLLLLSATLILSSSVLAELINTHCQRKGR